MAGGRNIDVLLSKIEGAPHLYKRGHWPVWYELGAGKRECMECIFKRSGGPRSNRLRPVPAFSFRPV